MGNTYDLNDSVRVSTGTNGFTDADGNAYDPDVVRFKFQDPSANETTYIYGTNPEIVKDDTGKYHVDLDADEVGMWYVRWEGETTAGVAQAADEWWFYVQASKF